jgi:hypothetical protein
MSNSNIFKGIFMGFKSILGYVKCLHELEVIVVNSHQLALLGEYTYAESEKTNEVLVRAFNYAGYNKTLSLIVHWQHGRISKSVTYPVLVPLTPEQEYECYGSPCYDPYQDVIGAYEYKYDL